MLNWEQKKISSHYPKYMLVVPQDVPPVQVSHTLIIRKHTGSSFIDYFHFPIFSLLFLILTELEAASFKSTGWGNVGKILQEMEGLLFYSFKSIGLYGHMNHLKWYIYLCIILLHRVASLCPSYPTAAKWQKEQLYHCSQS